MSEDLEELLGSVMPSHEQRASLEKLIADAVEQKGVIEATEELLKTLKAHYHELVMSTIPKAMGATSSIEVQTPRGLASVKIEDFVNGSLPKAPDRKREAIDWLIKHDGEGLIKREISLTFPRGDNSIGAVREALAKLGVDFKEDMGVHHSTLHAFAKERMKKGHDLDPDVLGLFVGRTARIKLPEEEG